MECHQYRTAEFERAFPPPAGTFSGRPDPAVEYLPQDISRHGYELYVLGGWVDGCAGCHALECCG